MPQTKGNNVMYEFGEQLIERLWLDEELKAQAWSHNIGQAPKTRQIISV